MVKFMRPMNPPDKVPPDVSTDSGIPKGDGVSSLESTVSHIADLPRDVGWLLVTAGIIGEIAPGIIGTPFWIMGSLILWPSVGRHVESWLEALAPTVFRGGVRQVGRFLNDLDRRYPLNGRKP